MVAHGKLLFAGKLDQNLRSLIDRLEEAGYHCIQVLDRNGALSVVENARLDLFVTCLEFDGQPDMQVIRSINPAKTQISTIMIVYNPTIESAAEAVRLSLSAYVVSPFEVDDVYELIVSCISSNQARRTCSEIVERMEEWTKDIERLEQYLNVGAGNPGKFDMQNFVPLTIGRILGAVLDLKALLDIATNKPVQHDMCHMLSCPRLNAFQEVTEDTIVTLEKTKNYFKSRDLHELRLRLEQFLKDQKN